MAIATAPKALKNSSSCRRRSRVLDNSASWSSPFCNCAPASRHRRARNGPLTRFAPVGHGSFDDPALGVMLGEELRLVFYYFWKIGFERVGDLRMQLPAGLAQQAAVSCVLHQRVLEGVDRFGRRA